MFPVATSMPRLPESNDGLAKRLSMSSGSQPAAATATVAPWPPSGPRTFHSPAVRRATPPPGLRRRCGPVLLHSSRFTGFGGCHLLFSTSPYVCRLRERPGPPSVIARGSRHGRIRSVARPPRDGLRFSSGSASGANWRPAIAPASFDSRTIASNLSNPAWRAVSSLAYIPMSLARPLASPGGNALFASARATNPAIASLANGGYLRIICSDQRRVSPSFFAIGRLTHS